MVKRGKFLLFLAFLMLLVSCEKEFDKYYKVEESGGTIVEILKANEDFSMFVEALENTGVREGENLTSFSSILGSSGLFTVLAVNNTDFTDFLSSKFGVASISSIPSERIKELDDVMATHIMDWSYSANNLTHGYSSEEEPFNPLMIKKTSRYREPIREDTIQAYVIDGGLVEDTFKIVSEPKMLTFYSQDYMNEAEVTDGDFGLFYPGVNVNFSEGEILVSGAKIIQTDIPALNGWIHQVDNAIEPQPNHREIIESDENYSLFYKMAHPFAFGDYNDYYTDQFSSAEGDAFLELLYSMDWFNLDTEFVGSTGDYPNTNTKRKAIQETSVTAFIPNNTTLSAFLDNQFGLYYPIPVDVSVVDELAIKKLVKSCIFQEETVWPSQMMSGSVKSRYSLPFEYMAGQIQEYKAASNGLFYGIQDFNTPDEFRCLTRLPMVNPEYSMFLHAMDRIDYFALLISDPNVVEYTVFLVKNEVFEAAGYTFVDDEFYYDDEVVRNSELEDILSQHVIDEKLDINWSDKKYYKTVSGNYVAVNSDGIVGAGNEDEFAVLGEDSEEYNGIAYDVSSFILPTETYVGEIIASNATFSEFRSLMEEAEILQNGRVVILQGQISTCFLPSNSAIIAAKDAGLIPVVNPENEEATKAELANWLAKYFISEPVFSDGGNQGRFATLRYNPDLSTPYSRIYESVDVSVSGHIITVADDKSNSISSEADQGDIMARNGIIHLVNEIY